jgi:hypothetical protein
MIAGIRAAGSGGGRQGGGCGDVEANGGPPLTVVVGGGGMTITRGAVLESGRACAAHAGDISCLAALPRPRREAPDSLHNISLPRL